MYITYTLYIAINESMMTLGHSTTATMCMTSLSLASQVAPALLIQSTL